MTLNVSLQRIAKSPFVLNYLDWQNQFETLKPFLFVFDHQNKNEEILDYFENNNIQVVQFDNVVYHLDDI